MRFGDVGVQVQAHHDRDIVPNDRAQSAEQFAFAVVMVFGRHRAVQVEVDRIRPNGLCRIEDLAGDALVGVAGDPSGRAGRRPDHGHDVPVVGPRGGEKAAHRDVDVLQFVECLAASQ
nr:hypothetical protein [Streptomyces sp. NBC_00893]